MDTGLTAQSDERHATLVERFARLVEDSGGPRIAGRVAAVLLLSPDALPLDEIAERLQASKASISTNARMLERWGLVERVCRPGDRRDFYRARQDSAVNLLERRLVWLRRLGEVAAEGARATAEDPPVVHERFTRMCQMHGFAQRSVERILRYMRREPAR